MLRILQADPERFSDDVGDRLHGYVLEDWY